MLLLPTRPNDGRNPVVAMGGLALLVLHLPGQLGGWRETVNDVHAKHCRYVLVLEGLELPRIDAPRLPSVAHNGLGV